jgi:hypothetical protein
MHPTELRFIELARQVSLVGRQAAMAYEQAQAALQLDQLITPERIATAEGTRRSLETLAALAQLHAAHKDMYAKFMTSAMQQYTDAIAELPDGLAREYREGIVGALNRQLESQASFYRNRDKWIAAVNDMFTMIDEQRDALEYIDGEVRFEDDSCIDRFNELIETIDAIHHQEVALMQDRLARAAAAAALLDAAAPPR